MTPRHVLLALVVVAIWGANFVVIKAALATLPPLLFAALRFALAFFPAALFVARPDVPWRTLAAYGTLIGAGQFGLMFIAMRADITRTSCTRAGGKVGFVASLGWPRRAKSTRSSNALTRSPHDRLESF